MNFDPASDNESGISCYQYAIGTSPGGNEHRQLDEYSSQFAYVGSSGRPI